MSFSIADKPGIISDDEQYALDGLGSRPDVFAIEVRGRNADGEIVAKVHVSDSDDSVAVLISDEADGPRVSCDGITYLPEPQVVL